MNMFIFITPVYYSNLFYKDYCFVKVTTRYFIVIESYIYVWLLTDEVTVLKGTKTITFSLFVCHQNLKKIKHKKGSAKWGCEIGQQSSPLVTEAPNNAAAPWGDTGKSTSGPVRLQQQREQHPWRPSVGQQTGMDWVVTSLPGNSIHLVSSSQRAIVPSVKWGSDASAAPSVQIYGATDVPKMLEKVLRQPIKPIVTYLTPLYPQWSCASKT